MDSKTAIVGKHAFSEHHLQRVAQTSNIETFSIGVFAWEARVCGKGVKAGAAKVRVTGLANNPSLAISVANEVVRQLDAGTYLLTKGISATKNILMCLHGASIDEHNRHY